MSARIGVLTGTFDPPHLGHIALAQAALATGEIDAVWFMPNPVPAHKTQVTAYEHRLMMVELALRGVPGVGVAPVAVRHEPQTISGFRRLMAAYPGTTWRFIAGTDTLAGLDTWKDYAAVVREVVFLVAERPGTPVVVLDDLRGRLGDVGRLLTVTPFRFESYTTTSSRVAREALRKARWPPALGDQVMAYILEHGLYR